MKKSPGGAAIHPFTQMVTLAAPSSLLPFSGSWSKAWAIGSSFPPPLARSLIFCSYALRSTYPKSPWISEWSCLCAFVPTDVAPRTPRLADMTPVPAAEAAPGLGRSVSHLSCQVRRVSCQEGPAVAVALATTALPYVYPILALPYSYPWLLRLQTLPTQ